MQYTYWPISQELKTIRQWNLVSQENVTWERLFLAKSYPRYGGETISTPFSKKLKLCISLDQ